jgi:hypothetical protein
MSNLDNPRALPGDNSGEVDFAKLEAERLALDYAELARVAQEAKDKGDAITEIVDNDGRMEVATIIKNQRDIAKRADGFRELVKMPHLRRGQGVDSFFFGIIDLLARRDKKSKPGSSDRLQSMLTDYDNRVLAEEQERRRLAAVEAQRLARIAAEKQAELDRQAEEARAAAERARAPAQVEKKAEIAQVADVAASGAKVDATILAGKAEDAYVETLAKPADIMRSRSDEGVLATVAREGYAEIVDQSKLDFAALWPFISLDAKEKALRQWAKAQGHTVMMTGASIGFRNKSVVR